MARRTEKETKKEPTILKGKEVEIEIREWKDSNNKITRFATLKLFECITIYQCRIMTNKDGKYFIALPSYKDKNEKYWNYVYIDKDDEISKEIDSLLNDEELPFV